MAEVTDIKKQIKNPQMFSVFVDGKFAFSFDQNALLKNEVKIGKKLNKHELEKLEKRSAENKVYNLAYKKALRRPHSQKEIERYLYKKKLSKESIEDIVKKLTKNKLLNDQDFAETYALFLSKKHSLMEIKSKLIKKGVSSKNIDMALESLDLDPKENIEKLIDKKSKSKRYSDKKKLIQYLMRKGFRYSDIQAVLEKKED